MKSQKFKRVIVVLLVTAMAVAIPSSFAKYADTVTIDSAMTVKRKMFSIFNTYPGISKDKCIVRLPQVGYYAIIAKGGDGANGDSYSGDISQGYKYEGGIGGTVVGVYQTTEPNQFLFVAPGMAGGRPNPNCKPNVSINPAVPGISGLNIAYTSNNDKKFFGGSGATLDISDVDKLVKEFSKSPASGGGGAASLVYKCDEKGNYTSSDILMVAAGGGAGGSWNEGYRQYESGWNPLTVLGTSYPAGFGGDGGSNYCDGKLYAPITFTNSKYSFSFSEIYDGYNATGNVETRGKAGTSGGVGSGGTSETTGWNLIVGRTAGSGTSFNSGGNGGAGIQYGGGGGAGYYGGGGGAGTSISIVCGGGGGGASYIAPSISQTKKVSYTDIIGLVDDIGDKSIPLQHPYGDVTADGDGYVVIKYLGTIVDEGSFTVKASDLGQYILHKYVNSSTVDIVTNNDTSNASYKTLMGDTAISNLLNNRLWTICYENSTLPTYSSGVIPVLYFSDGKNITSTSSKITVWRYKDGAISKATNASVTRERENALSPYKYSLSNPGSATYKEADFALS